MYVKGLQASVTSWCCASPKQLAHHHITYHLYPACLSGLASKAQPRLFSPPRAPGTAGALTLDAAGEGDQVPLLQHCRPHVAQPGPREGRSRPPVN